MNGEPMMLVCTRLSDMTVMHPDQGWELCSQCQHTVGVYPTGKRAIERWPHLKILCMECANLQAIGPEDEIYAAGTLEEIVKERNESAPTGKA
jgi:hypothetical protein